VEFVGDSKTKGKRELQEGKYFYNVLAENQGLQTFSGNVIFNNESGQKVTLPFETQYMVAKPTAATVTKYLVKDIENPLSVSISGIPAHTIKVEASEGTITGKMGSFRLTPSKTGPCTVTVKAEINGQLKTIDTYTFEVIEKK